MTTEPTPSTKYKLFALSGNRCAFPDCTHTLVDEATGTPVYEIAHIKAENRGGPRYDKHQTDDERRAFDNLMLLCPNHHDLIDKNPKLFPEERLYEMKRQHETTYSNRHPSPELQAAFGASVHSNTVIGGSIITNTGQNLGIMAHEVHIGKQTRSLSAEQSTVITRTLRQYPLGQCDLSALYGDGDAGLLMDSLMKIILASGTNIRNYSPSTVTSPPPRGIVIRTARQSPAVSALLNAFYDANLAASIEIRPDAEIPHIFVGVNQ